MQKTNDRILAEDQQLPDWMWFLIIERQFITIQVPGKREIKLRQTSDNNTAIQAETTCVYKQFRIAPRQSGSSKGCQNCKRAILQKRHKCDWKQSKCSKHR